MRPYPWTAATLTIDTGLTTLAEGTMRVAGDRAVVERFGDLCALPAKIGNEGNIE